MSHSLTENGIKKHSEAVSGDFFANENTSNDYSLKAEAIFKSEFCEQEKSDIEEYINTYGENKSSKTGKQKNKQK